MKKLYIAGTAVLLAATAFMMTSAKTAPVAAVNLKCESLVDPLAIDSTTPHFSWTMDVGSEQGEMQTAYQILVASSPELLTEGDADLWNSGKVAAPLSPFVDYGGKELKAKDIAYWKVRVWNKLGKASAWSEPAFFGVGLLEPSDWAGVYIGKAAGADNDNSPLLRKCFDWSGGDRAMLHVNSLGYHEAYVNGRPVSDAVLTPAVTQYGKRSLAVTYDITPLLQEGTNDITLWLGRGWFHESFPGGVPGGPYVRAQLEVFSDGGWHTALATDSTWQAAESGYSSFGSWWPHQFGGETVDARKAVTMSPDILDSIDWKNVTVGDVPAHAVSPQMAEFNRVQRRFHPVSGAAAGDSTWIYDMGTNFTGWTDIAFTGLEPGQKVRIIYCDFPDNDGNFRDGLYEDFYIASGNDGERFLNKFNYKAYRYLKLSGLAKAPAAGDIEACLIHTDYSGDASFECSDSDLNAIYNMMAYTMKCLTLGGYMVDCPQIERLGYGGDGNASTPFVQTLFNMAPTYINWMQAWADCQRPGGSMPNTAPNPYTAGGGPYWGGFIITASWQTYLNYGDRRLLERFYPNMQQWLQYVKEYTVDGLLTPWPETDYRGWFLGDWATPTGIDQTDPQSVGLVTNCYIAVCYDTMAQIAETLGRPDDATAYSAEAVALRRLIHQKFYDRESCSYGTGTQIDLVYPMLAGVTPADCMSAVEQTLKRVTTERFGGHLATGLMGLPVITEWATASGEAQFMYDMLKKRDYPGFLYMLDNGATTTWEHWNGERSRIHNCYNSLGTWFYRALAGIVPMAPGYAEVTIAPQTVDGIDYVRASKETPFGLIAVAWKRTDEGTIALDVDIPAGVKATLASPNPTVLAPGHHSLRY